MSANEYDNRDQFEICGWKVNTTVGGIYRNGQELIIGKKMMRLLRCLAEHQNEIVTKEQLLSTVWPDVIVSNDSLRKSISELRQIFKPGDQPIEIETIRGVGYRLKSDVNWPSVVAHTPKHRSTAFRLAAACVILLLMLIAWTKDRANPPTKKIFDNLLVVRSPRISKVKPRVVYASYQKGESRLYMYDEVAKEHTLIDKSGMPRSEVAISNDGNHVAYLSQKEGKKYLFKKNLISGEKKILTELKYTPLQSHIDWSKDDQKIAFSNCGGMGQGYRVHLIDRFTHKLDTIQSSIKSQNGEMCPRFNPTGNKLAFVGLTRSTLFHDQFIQGRGNVIIKDLETNEDFQLTSDNTEICGMEWIDDQTLCFIKKYGSQHYILSIDVNTKKIDTLYSSIHLLRHLTYSDQKIWVEEWDVPYEMKTFSGLNSSSYSFQSLFSNENRFWHPEYSPDAQKLCRVQIAEAGYQLIIRNLDNHNDEIIQTTQAPMIHPRWAKDNSAIYYTVYEEDMGLYKYDLTTGTTLRITEGYINTFTPKGDYIYYVKSVNCIWSAFKLDLTSLKSEPIECLSTIYFAAHGSNFVFVKENADGLWYFDSTTKAEHLITPDLKIADDSHWLIDQDIVYYWKRDDFKRPILMAYHLVDKTTHHIYSHRKHIHYTFSGFTRNPINGDFIFPTQLDMENTIKEIDLLANVHLD